MGTGVCCGAGLVDAGGTGGCTGDAGGTGGCTGDNLQLRGGGGGGLTGVVAAPSFLLYC